MLSAVLNVSPEVPIDAQPAYMPVTASERLAWRLSLLRLAVGMPRSWRRGERCVEYAPAVALDNHAPDLTLCPY